MKISEPTTLEKVSGSISAGIAANTFSTLAASSTPLAVFVPFLLQSLATGRHTKRVDKALNEINEILALHEESIKNISDTQFKLINEVISTIFQTTNNEKIIYLKSVINNTITSSEIDINDVDYISRIIRDISSDEIKFILNNFKYRHIFIGEAPEKNDSLIIKENSKDEIIVSGLINMGLLYTKTSLYGAVSFEFSPVVVKVIVLLTK